MGFNLKLILLSKKILLASFSIIILGGFVSLKDWSEHKGKKLNKFNEAEVITNPMVDWKVNYEKTIEYLKIQEGFADGKPYICPGGFKTIGYGHVILEGENFEELTEKQADSLLRVDFDRALRAVDKTVKLSALKKLAIAHFVFAKGIGTFINSGLKDKVVRGESIDNELLEFCYYTNIDGKRIKSQHALVIRKWELDLYNLKS
jgi:lysozyme